MMMLKMYPLLHLSPWRRRRNLLSQTPPSSNRESRRDSFSSTLRCCTMKWIVAEHYVNCFMRLQCYATIHFIVQHRRVEEKESRLDSLLLDGGV
jgi:hypothetical protein